MIQKSSAIDPHLFEEDETAWLESMAELIERGRFEELDYPHLAEYLSDMAKRDRREVESRLAVLLAHLLKWEHQPKKRTKSWRTTIVIQRQDLARLLGRGVLRNHAEAVLEAVFQDAVEQAETETGLARETFPQRCPYSIEQVLSPELLGEV